MTGGQLRDELARIAEGAPDVQVPDDTFARGRRATMRTRVLVATAAAACVGLIAAVATPIVRSHDAEVADRDAPGGVPDVIYVPPGGAPVDLPITSLDKVGPAAAAYLADDIDGRVVVITAEGDYRLIELPSYQESAVNEITPLLSPDGTQLAYTTQNRLSTFLALLDLTTGQVRQVPLTSGLGAIVTTAQFSPDGDWLAWSGQKVSSREGSRETFRLGVVGGLIRTATAESRRLPDVARAGWDGLGRAPTEPPSASCGPGSSSTPSDAAPKGCRPGNGCRASTAGAHLPRSTPSSTAASTDCSAGSRERTSPPQSRSCPTTAEMRTTASPASCSGSSTTTDAHALSAASTPVPRTCRSRRVS